MSNDSFEKTTIMWTVLCHLETVSTHSEMLSKLSETVCGYCDGQKILNRDRLIDDPSVPL